MLNIKKLFVPIVPVIISATLILSACGTTKTTTTPETPAKEVGTFVVGTTSTPLSFTKSGQANSSKTAIIMPEIAGKVTSVKVKVGDKVTKGQTLVTLGNSLSTDATNISYETAIKGIDLINASQLKMDYSAQKDIEAVMIGYYTAKEALEKAIKTSDNSEDLYDEQHDYLDDQVDKLKDALDEMENMPDYEQNETYQQTLATYEQLDSQLEQTEIGHDMQLDQTEMGLDVAKRGLQSAILAVEGVQAKYSLQFIQSDANLLQAQSGADIARLQKEAQYVRSPIEGVVTSIQATENNITAPGQVIAIVSDLSQLKIETSINENEMPLLKIGDKVEISGTSMVTATGTTESASTNQDSIAYGTISTISPALSSYTNKISVEIIPEESANFLSGSLVDISFKPDTTSIFIPLKTVTIEDKTYYVKLISEGSITKKTIQVGRIIGEFIEVTEGLNKGDIIAISSTTFLKEGDKVVYKIPRI